MGWIEKRKLSLCVSFLISTLVIETFFVFVCLIYLHGHIRGKGVISTDSSNNTIPEELISKDVVLPHNHNGRYMGKVSTTFERHTSLHYKYNNEVKKETQKSAAEFLLDFQTFCLRKTVIFPRDNNLTLCPCIPRNLGK